MSWLWKGKSKGAKAEADPNAKRISTVAQELPILHPEDEILFFDPFDLAQRKKDEAICPMFAAERAAYLNAKATGQPLVNAEASSHRVSEPPTPTEGEEETAAEEWTEDPSATPSSASDLTTEPSVTSVDDAQLQKLIAEEAQKVEQMRVELGMSYPEDDKNNQKKYKLQLDFLRFLRARKMVVADAAAMYKAAEEWIDKENLRNILAKPDPLMRCFQSITPHRNHGVDYHGNPVYYERTGMVVVANLLKHMSEEDVVLRHLRYLFYSMDRMAVSSKTHGKNVTKVVMIHDLAHLKFTVETAGVRIFKKTVSCDQNYFPERLHKAFIINAPLSFRGAWAVVKPLLDAKTSKKIEILGSNYHEALLDVIPPSQLPAHYGGLCQCTYENDPKDFCLPHKVRKVDDPDSELNPEWPIIIPRSEEQMQEALQILEKAKAKAAAE